LPLFNIREVYAPTWCYSLSDKVGQLNGCAQSAVKKRLAHADVQSQSSANSHIAVIPRTLIREPTESLGSFPKLITQIARDVDIVMSKFFVNHSANVGQLRELIAILNLRVNPQFAEIR
jgi:hypothetical protein